jgi:hypothetical protein
MALKGVPRKKPHTPLTFLSGRKTGTAGRDGAAGRPRFNDRTPSRVSVAAVYRSTKWGTPASHPRQGSPGEPDAAASGVNGERDDGRNGSGPDGATGFSRSFFVQHMRLSRGAQYGALTSESRRARISSIPDGRARAPPSLLETLRRQRSGGIHASLRVAAPYMPPSLTTASPGDVRAPERSPATSCYGRSVRRSLRIMRRAHPAPPAPI